MFGSFQFGDAYFAQPPDSNFFGHFWKLRTHRVIKPLINALRKVHIGGKITTTVTEDYEETHVSMDEDL